MGIRFVTCKKNLNNAEKGKRSFKNIRLFMH